MDLNMDETTFDFRQFNLIRRTVKDHLVNLIRLA